MKIEFIKGKRNYYKFPIGFYICKVNSYNNINLGNAFIRLDLGDELKDYQINIISLNDNDSVKNIFFEISDDRLLNKTGGVVQGMSGSPIIQDDKIIGVVNYVVVGVLHVWHRVHVVVHVVVCHLILWLL